MVGVTDRLRANDPPASRPLFMATILYVDDEPSVGLILDDTLSQAGHTAVGARGVPEALQVLERGGIDLIISEFRLPRLEGLSFLDIINRGAFGQAPPPLIFCSALLQSEGWMRKLADEGIPLLVRPFTPHAFELALAAAFAAD